MSDFQSLLNWSQQMQRPQQTMQMQPLKPPSLLETTQNIKNYFDQQQVQHNQLPQPQQNPQQAIAQAMAAIPQLQNQNGQSGKGGGQGGSITGAMKNIAVLLS